MLINNASTIKLLEVIGDTTINFSETQKSLERLKASPFKITAMKDGYIIYMEEIFIP